MLRDFAAAGVVIDAAQRCIETAFVGTNEALVSLRLPMNPVARTGLLLHPAMVDGALQATVVLQHSTRDASSTTAGQPLLLFSVDRVDVIEPLEVQLWAWIRRGSVDTNRIDIDLLDLSGGIERVCTASAPVRSPGM